MIVDKSKLIILKVDKLFLIIPLTVTKVETRLRNVIINGKPKFEGLSRFMQFYLSTIANSTASTVPVKSATSAAGLGPRGAASAKVAHAP